jgi:uncharacterized damage-inducible protein DinB
VSISNAYLAEFEQELRATRTCLERLPEDKLDWQPHPRSMSLGRLALHLATIPQFMLNIAQPDEFDFGTLDGYTPESATSIAQLLEAHDASAQFVREQLPALDDARMGGNWRVLRGGNELMALPRAAMLRSFLLNHWIHHRGQLSVYMRLLDVPVPSIYGPSADDNPFA